VYVWNYRAAHSITYKKSRGNMNITLELKDQSDLKVLLPLLERLGIKVVKKTPVSEQRTLGDYIGTMPTIDAENFEQYLIQSREEWERPIS